MTQRFQTSSILRSLAATCGLAISLTMLLGADETPSVEPEAPRTTGIEFESFSYILANNIFASKRQDRERLEAERRRSQQRPIPVDRFALVGTMHNEGKAYAFFTGSDQDFRSVLNVGQDIAGYTVKSITKELVELKRDENVIEFRIGMEMTRQGSEDWNLIENSRSDWSQVGSGRRSGRSASSPSTTSSSAPKPAALSGDKADILRKMMERRKQQMNK